MVQKHASGSASFSAEASFSAVGTAVWLEESLLELARRLLAEDQPSMSIVVAHVACETAVTRCMASAFASRDQSDLAEPMLDAMNGHALVSRKNRELYVALTGDAAITKQQFWKDYHMSLEQRNCVVHSGAVYATSDAEVCLVACDALVEHLHARMSPGAGA